MTGPTVTTTGNRDFFDANILIYAYDRRDPVKQARAFDLVSEAIAEGTGVLSAQVLGEFFNTVTWKITNRIPVEVAEEAVDLFATLPVVALDLGIVQRAITTSRRYQISYWDGLIVAAAERAGCTRLVSEDLNAGQSYNGVTVVNPF